MVELKVAYIDPDAVLGALTVQPKIVQIGANLGPSSPHEFDEEIEDAEVPLGVPGLSTNAPAGVGQPGLSVPTPQVSVHPGVHPGAPPVVAATHYTQVLNELWPEFDDPEERTAARLESLLEEVADEAQRVLLLAQDVWEKLPDYKVPDSERKRYDAEFLAYLRRLNEYRTTLAELEPTSTATGSVYLGLVTRRQGAGPVPDAIMHLYFTQQLGILSDHGQEMSEGFVGRVMDALAKVDKLIDKGAETVAEAEEDAADRLDNAWDQFTRPWKIAGGILLGTVVLVGGTLIAISASKREPTP